MTDRIVNYCPGSAVGSPAGLTPSRADAQLVQDTQYIQLMAGVGALPEPVVYPHIGGTCYYCRRYHQDK